MTLNEQVEKKKDRIPLAGPIFVHGDGQTRIEGGGLKA